MSVDCGLAAGVYVVQLDGQWWGPLTVERPWGAPARVRCMSIVPMGRLSHATAHEYPATEDGFCSAYVASSPCEIVKGDGPEVVARLNGRPVGRLA